MQRRRATDDALRSTTNNQDSEKAQKQFGGIYLLVLSSPDNPNVTIILIILQNRLRNSAEAIFREIWSPDVNRPITHQ
jgi:hypothetical protein